jgi:hypothetical protein
MGEKGEPSKKMVAEIPYMNPINTRRRTDGVGWSLRVIHLRSVNATRMYYHEL